MPTKESSVGLALPRSTRKLVCQVGLNSRHAGLQLDKLSSAGDMERQKSALGDVTKTHQDQDNELLQDLLARRRGALDALDAKRLRMATRSSLTLHLSRPDALENAGIALHPVYGFVYVPGSGIKGLTRAWAETVWAPAQADQKKAWRQIEAAFGWSPQSEHHKFPQLEKGLSGWRPDEIKPQTGASAGRLVFHEAWPTRWPRLILDVVNNHHVDYYEGKDDPGDWENPNLAYFLAVGEGEAFEFAISDRGLGGDTLLETACGWLRNALINEGAGAKTAAGYGRFRPVEGEAFDALSPDFAEAGFASASFDLQLVTPAFLAGASQTKVDCDLRPATLRGLLRWWWRTMHAAHLDRKPLKQLETAVWGDAESGSPVRIAVDYVKGPSPVLYDHKDKFRPKLEFKTQNDLQDPPRKTTQGLFYVSHGMDDGGRKRWYRSAGTRWAIRIEARRSHISPDSSIEARRGHISPDSSSARTLELASAEILRQAVASLWLLCRFGGVGSKGRKGFGSFGDIEVKTISSLDDCQAWARSFRQICGLQQRSGMVCSPALEEMKMLEIATPWRNPWTALDQLGYAVQAFAQRYAHKEEKKALGLPRNIHGPRVWPMRHQSGGTHKPPQELSAKKGKRHAAPVHYHLAKSDNGLLIRATAFPSHWLPSLDESKRMLDELQRFLGTELKQRAEKDAGIGQREAKPQATSNVDLPKTNDRVDAELLEAKTKKGGWKARHVDSGLEGPIQDSVPSDAKPGQRVQLTVASASPKEIQFRWTEPSSSKKKAAWNSRQGSGRGGRR